MNPYAQTITISVTEMTIKRSSPCSSPRPHLLASWICAPSLWALLSRCHTTPWIPPAPLPSRDIWSSGFRALLSSSGSLLGPCGPFPETIWFCDNTQKKVWGKSVNYITSHICLTHQLYPWPQQTSATGALSFCKGAQHQASWLCLTGEISFWLWRGFCVTGPIGYNNHVRKP